MPTPSQRIIHAVRTRNHERLRELIREHEGPSARSAAGRTALHAAAEEGDREAVAISLAAGADINARMHNGLTPLHLAAARGGFCDLSDPDLDSRSPCDRPGKRSVNVEVAKAVTAIIKDKHPDIASDLEPTDDIPEEDKAAVFSAAIDCLTEPELLYKEIIARGVDIDRLDPGFSETLRGNPRFLGVVQLLLDHGADVNAVDDHGNSVLRNAVELGTAEIVKLLFKHGANPKENASEFSRSTPLIAVALERGKLDVAEALFGHDTQFDPQEPGPLHEAAANGRESALFWLLDHGANINVRNERGNTPLLSAANSGHDNIVTALIARGADVHVQNHQGRRVLHNAAGWPLGLEPLLRLGLPVNELDNEGRTALHHAAQGGGVEAIQLLLRAGASANIQDHAGNTPLHLAFSDDELRPDIEFPTFLALVSAGADRSLKNKENQTPFDLAKHWDYPEEYLKLLNPTDALRPDSFIWLGEKQYAGFLPQAMVSFKVDDVEWPSSEHYFNAQKTQDPEIQEHLRRAKTAGDVACRLRESKVKPPASWRARCDDVMRSALLAKFQQNNRLREQLLATGDAILVSDSNCEQYWVESRGTPFSTIGKMLMQIRSELRSKQ